MLTQSGIAAVQPGETLEVRVGPGHKGPHVTDVLSVDSSTAVPTASRRSNAQATTLNTPSVEETGTVKWFNFERGYGFIAPNEGGKDVFVHMSALERSGIEGLSEGQTVVVDVVAGRKGQGCVWCKPNHDQCGVPVTSDSCSIATVTRRQICRASVIALCFKLGGGSAFASASSAYRFSINTATPQMSISRITPNSVTGVRFEVLDRRKLGSES